MGSAKSLERITDAYAKANLRDTMLARLTGSENAPLLPITSKEHYRDIVSLAHYMASRQENLSVSALMLGMHHYDKTDYQNQLAIEYAVFEANGWSYRGTKQRVTHYQTGYYPPLHILSPKHRHRLEAMCQLYETFPSRSYLNARVVHVNTGTRDGIYSFHVQCLDHAHLSASWNISLVLREPYSMMHDAVCIKIAGSDASHEVRYRLSNLMFGYGYNFI